MPEPAGSLPALRNARQRVTTHDLSEAWESAAAGFTAWARAPMHDSYWRFHRDQFLEIVPAPGRLTLDIGCGEGRLSRDLKALGHAIVAIDSSPTMVENARQADSSIEVHIADAVTLASEHRPLEGQRLPLRTA